MTGTEIYKRTATYDREAQSIRLHAPHWKLLLAFDGLRSLSEVSLSAEIPFAETLPLTQKFLDSSWIEEMPITLEQYLKRAGARDLSGTGVAVSPSVVLHAPPSNAPATPTAVAPAPTIAPPPLPPNPVPSVKPVDAPKPATPPTTTASPTIAASPAVRPMRLSAVVDFVTSLVGNISLGQLLVYRVFLRVPPELLLAEDIASVHLVQDTSLIKGDKLQKAIEEAVQAVAKRHLPDSVFAAA